MNMALAALFNELEASRTRATEEPAKRSMQLDALAAYREALYAKAHAKIERHIALLDGEEFTANTLSTRASVSHRSVMNHLRELVEKGTLVARMSPKNIRMYRIKAVASKERK